MTRKVHRTWTAKFCWVTRYLLGKSNWIKYRLQLLPKINCNWKVRITLTVTVTEIFFINCNDNGNWKKIGNLNHTATDTATWHWQNDADTRRRQHPCCDCQQTRWSRRLWEQGQKVGIVAGRITSGVTVRSEVRQQIHRVQIVLRHHLKHHHRNHDLSWHRRWLIINQKQKSGRRKSAN